MASSSGAVRHAELALAAARTTLRDEQHQLDVGEREHQAATKAYLFDAAERQRPVNGDNVRRNAWRDAARTQHAAASWADAADLQHCLELAGAASASPSSAGRADETDQSPSMMQLTSFQRLIDAGHSAGLDPAFLSKMGQLFRQRVARALSDALSPSASLDAVARLSSVVDICCETGGGNDSVLSPLLDQAREVIKREQPKRVQRMATSLNQILVAVGGPAGQDATLLRDAIEVADYVASEAEGGEFADSECLRRLIATAQKRLEVRCEEVAQTEEVQRAVSAAAWQARRQQLTGSISVAKAAVEASEERLRLAEELERAEASKKEAAARHLKAQQQAKSDEQEKVQQAQQHVHDAKEEIKRLKWSLKLSQDGAQAAVRKAEEEIRRAKTQAAEETRQAQAEVRLKRRELEKATQRMRSASRRKERAFTEQEERQKKDIREQEERQQRLLSEEASRLAHERRMAQDARAEAERLRSEQDSVVGAWQKAETNATKLAAENASVAKEALEAQKKTEEEARLAHQEVKDMQDELTRKEEGLKKAMQEQEQAHELERRQAQQAKKEAELLKARQQELLEELKAERDQMQRARDKQEELEKFITNQRTEKEQLSEKMREKNELVKQADRDLKEAKEEINKLRAETAEAVEGRRKARKEAMRLKADQTEAFTARQTADSEAKEAKDKAETALKDMDKARGELRLIEVESTKSTAQQAAKHKEEVEEMIRKHERALAQKEEQLEYAEDALLRMEAKEKARKAKNAGMQQRIDEEVRSAYEKLRVKSDEANAMKKELDQATAKAKSAEQLKATLKREQKDQEDHFNKQLDQVTDAKASMELLKDEAEQAKERAQKAEKKAVSELEKLREQVSVLSVRLDAEKLAKEQAFARATSPQPVPLVAGLGASSGDVLPSQLDVEKLARAIADKLQAARNDGALAAATPAESSTASRAVPRQIIETDLVIPPSVRSTPRAPQSSSRLRTTPTKPSLKYKASGRS